MDDVSVFALLLRLVVSLGVVLGIMAVAAAVLRRSRGFGMGAGRGARRRPAEVEVLHRQPLGKRACLAVVRTGERALVLGVTEQSVTLLADAPADDLAPLYVEAPRTVPLGGDGTTSNGASTGPTWTAFIEQLRDRTVRRS
jgi:flagellar protein FliO/FliZ